MGWWEAIAQNLVSDAIFIVIVIVLGWLLLLVSGRRKLLTFFGVKESRRIVIYLSRIGVIEGGAVGIDGKTRSYSGFTGAFGEVQTADLFRKIFNYLLPALADIPDWLKKLLISDVEVEIKPSPTEMDILESAASFITLGSPAYNITSRFVEETLKSQARFELGYRDLSDGEDSKQILKAIADTGVATASTFELEDDNKAKRVATIAPVSDSSSATGPAKLVWYRENNACNAANTLDKPAEENVPSAIQLPNVPPITDLYQGFVERIVDAENERSVFYVAGISEFGTQGAAYHLATHWKDLAKKYKKDTSFVVLLCFEQNDYKSSTVVFEREG